MNLTIPPARMNGEVIQAPEWNQIRDALSALNAGKTEPGTDLTETVQDIVAAFIVAGANVTKTYDDAGTGTLTIAAAGGAGGTTDPETVRDTIAAALRAGTGITIASDDAADTITITLGLHSHTGAEITAGTVALARLGPVVAYAKESGGAYVRPADAGMVIFSGASDPVAVMQPGDLWAPTT